MKIIKGEIKTESNRDIYWAVINISSDDNEKHTRIFTCSSEEYLRKNFETSFSEIIDDKTLNSWLDFVIKKWSVLDSGIFNQSVHYDIYALTGDGENASLEFLFNLPK